MAPLAATKYNLVSNTYTQINYEKLDNITNNLSTQAGGKRKTRSACAERVDNF